jgi:divalent metal cation (Fe/Co/Zn/Cd) transporter
MSSNQILGIHDLIIHDYGPGRKFASVHAEIDCQADVVEAHEITDEIEQICFSKTDIELTIHMDPIDTKSPRVIQAKEIISNIVEKYEGVSYHDLRITDGENNINVIFDIVVPYYYKSEQLKEIVTEIKNKAKEENPKYSLVIKIDRPFVE